MRYSKQRQSFPGAWSWTQVIPKSDALSPVDHASLIKSPSWVTFLLFAPVKYRNGVEIEY
jgi:hypothetical protein